MSIHVTIDFGPETFREKHRRLKTDLLLTWVISIGGRPIKPYNYILSCRVACHIYEKYTRIILPVYDMRKYCLKCRSFALFKIFRGFGSKMKKIYFRDFWFSKLAICAKITIIPIKMHQRIIWKIIEKQTILFQHFFLHKAVIKRQCGIYLYSLL